MKVAIVEDELHTRKEIRRHIERYAVENGVSFQITEFADGDSITENYSGSYDLILMDVEMPLVDGMEAAGEIRKVDQEVTIIFITNAPQYAIKGYKVGALDYILKPVSYYAFSESIKRAITKIRARRPDDDYITISVKGGARKIGVSSIDYVEVIDHDLYFHVGTELIETRGTIRDVENELAPYHFFKCNKGCLINLARVTGYHRNDVVVGKTMLPVSRSRKKPLQEAIHAYLDGVT
jgi:DNA-binding LytR/AlgR family response regulator